MKQRLVHNGAVLDAVLPGPAFAEDGWEVMEGHVGPAEVLSPDNWHVAGAGGKFKEVASLEKVLALDQKQAKR